MAVKPEAFEVEEKPRQCSVCDDTELSNYIHDCLQETLIKKNPRPSKTRLARRLDRVLGRCPPESTLRRHLLHEPLWQEFENGKT